MTDEQLVQWNDKACASRAIIWHAHRLGVEITPDDFISRFADRYPHWDTACGMIGFSDMIDIGRDLGLYHHADVFRSQPKVREMLSKNQARGVYFFTNRQKNKDGTFSELFHVGFIENVDPDRWRIWTSFQDGTETDKWVLKDIELDDLWGYFLVCH